MLLYVTFLTRCWLSLRERMPYLVASFLLIFLLTAVFSSGSSSSPLNPSSMGWADSLPFLAVLSAFMTHLTSLGPERWPVRFLVLNPGAVRGLIVGVGKVKVASIFPRVLFSKCSSVQCECNFLGIVLPCITFQITMEYRYSNSISPFPRCPDD